MINHANANVNILFGFLVLLLIQGLALQAAGAQADGANVAYMGSVATRLSQQAAAHASSDASFRTSVARCCPWVLDDDNPVIDFVHFGAVRHWALKNNYNKALAVRNEVIGAMKVLTGVAVQNSKANDVYQDKDPQIGCTKHRTAGLLRCEVRHRG